MSDFKPSDWYWSPDFNIYVHRIGLNSMSRDEWNSKFAEHTQTPKTGGIFRQEDIDSAARLAFDKEMLEYITNSYRAVTYKRGDESIMMDDRGSVEENTVAEDRKASDSRNRSRLGVFLSANMESDDSFVFIEGKESTGPMGGKSFEILAVDDNGVCFAINIYSDSRIEEKVDRKVRAEKAERERVAERLSVLRSLSEDAQWDVSVSQGVGIDKEGTE